MDNEISIWDDVGGKVGVAHPDTSQKASKTVKSGSQKAQIMLALSRCYPDGMTGYELSDFVFNGAGKSISPNQTCTRLLELRESGFVEFMRDYEGGPILEKATTPGNTGQLHRLTDSGVRSAAGLGGQQATPVQQYSNNPDYRNTFSRES